MNTKETDLKETNRIEAFSDGVFAIAITLLVLDIHVPEAKENAPLLPLLLHDWQTYLAFLIGFFTLLVCWINHHYMFEMIQKNDGVLLLLNGFKLLVVSFTPFATAVISKYIATPQQGTAVTIYALNFFLMGSAMTGIWIHAVRCNLITKTPPAIVRAATRLYVFASILSGTIFILSFATITVSLVLFGVMFLIFVLPRKMVRRMALSRSPALVSAAQQ